MAEKFLGYVRVSTDEQADKGLSLDSQRAKVRAYATLHGLDLVDVIDDPAESGENLDRPGLQRVLATLDRGEADGVCVYCLDRLSRSVKDFNSVVDRYFERPGRRKRKGRAAAITGRRFRLVSVTDTVDTRTATGRLGLNVRMSVAQFEREILVERTIAALAVKRERGERIGTVPLGYRLLPSADPKTKPHKLIPDQPERRAIAAVAELAAEGRSLRAIAAELVRRDLPSRKGGRWAVSSLGDLVNRLRGLGEGDPRRGLPLLFPADPGADDAQA